MHDTATRTLETLDELVAELEHADTLITEQQAHIDRLERQVRLLQVLLDARGAAAPLGDYVSPSRLGDYAQLVRMNPRAVSCEPKSISGRSNPRVISAAPSFSSRRPGR